MTTRFDFLKEGKLPRRRFTLRRLNFLGRSEVGNYATWLFTGLAALAAGTLNCRALPILRNPPQDARNQLPGAGQRVFATGPSADSPILFENTIEASKIHFILKNSAGARPTALPRVERPDRHQSELLHYRPGDGARTAQAIRYHQIGRASCRERV